MSITKCNSPSALNAELEGVRRKVSLQETEDSWDTIEQGIVQLTECCNNGGCAFATEMVAAIRSLSRPLNNAINSERSRLSGSAVKLVITLSTGLGPTFESLLPIFMKSLLGLCARANKLFVTRAKACIIAVIQHTRSPSILPYLAESVNHKSPSLRLVAAEGVLACLNAFKPSDVTRIRRFEDVIKLTTRDASADVRAVGKKICEAYKAILPETAVNNAPVTSVVQKTGILGTVGPPRQGVLCAPLGPGLRPTQSVDQRRDALRPLVTTTSRPQQMPKRQDEGLRILDKPLRVPVSSARRPETNNAERARATRPSPVKPSSPPKSLIPRYGQMNNLVATKTKSLHPTYRASVRSSSQNEPRPLAPAGHPAVSSRTGQLRPRGPQSKEVKLPKVSSQPFGRVVASGERPVTTGPKHTVQAPPMRLYLDEAKNRNIREIFPENIEFSPVRPVAVPLASPTVFLSHRMESATSAQPSAPAKTNYTLPAPPARPPRTGSRIRKSPFRPRRHNNPCTKTPTRDSTPRMENSPRDFFTSTPCGSFSLPLSPPRIHRAILVAHTHALGSPRISCLQSCGLRRAIDIQLDRTTARQESRITTPPKDPFTLTSRGSFSPPLPSLAGVTACATPNRPSDDSSCLQGCQWRDIPEIDLDYTITHHGSTMEAPLGVFFTSTPRHSLVSLEPFYAYGAEDIVHTHASKSPPAM